MNVFLTYRVDEEWGMVEMGRKKSTRYNATAWLGFRAEPRKSEKIELMIFVETNPVVATFKKSIIDFMHFNILDSNPLTLTFIEVKNLSDVVHFRFSQSYTVEKYLSDSTVFSATIPLYERYSLVHFHSYRNSSNYQMIISV